MLLIMIHLPEPILRIRWAFVTLDLVSALRKKSLRYATIFSWYCVHLENSLKDLVYSSSMINYWMWRAMPCKKDPLKLNIKIGDGDYLVIIWTFFNFCKAKSQKWTPPPPPPIKNFCTTVTNIIRPIFV